MIGLSILLLLGVLNWDDCLSEKSAWDTLAWFAVLVGMAGQLTNLGVVTWMSDCVAKVLQSLSLSWPAAFGLLQAAYFFIHYLFASQTGHVGALFSAFLAMHIAAGVPGILAALALAYNTNLFGALTHYSSGQAAVYYGGILRFFHPRTEPNRTLSLFLVKSLNSCICFHFFFLQRVMLICLMYSRLDS